MISVSNSLKQWRLYRSFAADKTHVVRISDKNYVDWDSYVTQFMERMSKLSGEGMQAALVQGSSVFRCEYLVRRSMYYITRCCSGQPAEGE